MHSRSEARHCILLGSPHATPRIENSSHLKLHMISSTHVSDRSIVKHITLDCAVAAGMDDKQLERFAAKERVPLDLLKECRDLKRLPVVTFAAGTLTPRDHGNLNQYIRGTSFPGVCSRCTGYQASVPIGTQHALPPF